MKGFEYMEDRDFTIDADKVKTIETKQQEVIIPDGIQHLLGAIIAIIIASLIAYYFIIPSRDDYETIKVIQAQQHNTFMDLFK